MQEDDSRSVLPCGVHDVEIDDRIVDDAGQWFALKIHLEVAEPTRTLAHRARGSELKVDARLGPEGPEIPQYRLHSGNTGNVNSSAYRHICSSL